MVSETVLGAAIGVGGAVIGSLLTGIFNILSTNQQVDSANQRQRAEFVAERKADELLNMSKVMSDARRVIVSSLLKAEKGDEVNPENVAEASIKYRDQIYAAQMFLEDEKMAELNNFYNELITAEAYIMTEIGEELHHFEERIIVRGDDEEFDLNEHAADFDLEEFEEGYRKALQVLRWEMVEPIERLR